MYAFAIHVIDGITATTANTDHLDDAVLFFGFTEVEQYVIIHSICQFINLFFIFYHFLTKLL